MFVVLRLTVGAVRSISTVMRSSLAILPLLGGCVFAPQPELSALEPGDFSPAAGAFELALPHQALAFLEPPGLWLPAEPGCPMVSVGIDGVERWQGGCTLADGSILLGQLERLEGPVGSWVAGDGLHLISPHGDTLLYLDGAVELEALGELSGIGVATTACGLVHACDHGPAQADLAFTLYPHSGVPLYYDVAVDGVVSSAALVPTVVSGAYSVDLDACASEPASGSLLLDGAHPWAVDFDGATACDGCAALALEGLPIGSGCTDWLASH